jgi:hypothetical protein
MNVDDKQMERAIELVKRAKEREKEGKNLLPKSYTNWKSKSEEIPVEEIKGGIKIKVKKTAVKKIKV